MNSFRVFILLCIAVIPALGAFCAEKADPAAPTPVTPAEMEKLKLFSDADAGFSLRIPAGFERLSEDETREVFHGISEYLGKQAGERVLRRPPLFFKGPRDEKDPKLKPASLALGYYELDEPVDPAQMSYYKEKVEEYYRKKGDRYGDVSVSLVSVDGINALRLELDVLSPVDNSRARLIQIAVPGNGRRYEIDFTFSQEQTASIEPAVATVLRSFKLDNRPVLDPETKGRWTRIAIWTVGGFLLGIVLSMLLKVLSGAGESAPENQS